MIENAYAFYLPHGSVFLYGENLNHCKTYVDTSIDSFEDLCIYCKNHGLRIYYLGKKSVPAFFEGILIRTLTRKYGVYSSWKEIQHYLNVHEDPKNYQ